jgi:hypothetical protein
MPWYEQSGGFHGSAAVNRRLGSPLARGDGELPLLNSLKCAILSRNRRNLADVRILPLARYEEEAAVA